MTECPKCRKMTAELNHYNGDLVCYNRDCKCVTSPTPKGWGDISKLNYKDGGIPETGKINKNRTALFWFDRKKHHIRDLDSWIEEAMLKLVEDEIDTIIIEVKERTW